MPNNPMADNRMPGKLIADNLIADKSTSPDGAVFSPCVLIPCYNHGAMMARVLERLMPFGLACFIVDDGSDVATQQQLTALVAAYPAVRLLRLEQNTGKGHAVIFGLKAAAQAGFSHALQVDADGQHKIEDVPQMLAAARQQPQKLISGQPIYDHSMPTSRRYGRYITHVWVWIETLSLSLKDSMCGFRVYPIAATLALADETPLGKRMDFDTEVMVRLYWQGTESYFVPTPVIYPADGLSHFDALRDNYRISRMHSRLFLAMLPRIPHLLLRRRRKARHWSAVTERNGLAGMRFMLQAYRLLGRSGFTLLLWPVVGYFWLTGRQQRKASQGWLRQITSYALQQKIKLPQPLNSFRHFLRFGGSMLNKVAGWRGDLRWGHDISFAPGAEAALFMDNAGGKLILASHLGDIEACRALAQHHGRVRINALVFSEHAPRFKQLLEDIAPQAGVNLIPVSDIGPETAIMLKDKLDAGEWVAIVGDRTAVNPQRGGERRVVWSQFLGQPAPFPQGPFLLAAALRCPVLLMFALHYQGKLRIYGEPFADPLTLPRQTRQQALQQAVDRYAQRLERHALLSPLDWFNFFDFWHLPDGQQKPPEKE